MSRRPWIDGREALERRMQRKAQLGAHAWTETALPPYAESFLAHLRLLVGVPFEYLVPDASLLPSESIRFFYLDPTWMDRLVDGAMAVGRLGSREQALQHAHHDMVARVLDVREAEVRTVQRGDATWIEVQRKPGAAPRVARGNDRTITGLLIRSSLVSGWPHVDVRAYDTADPDADLPVGYDPEAEAIRARQLPLLRLERLAPAVLLALFRGVPGAVVLEEPFQGVQFGASTDPDTRKLEVALRTPSGDETGRRVAVPIRDGPADGPRVVDLFALRDALETERKAVPAAGGVTQNGPAALAVAMLKRPYRQRYQGDGGAAPQLGESSPLRVQINRALGPTWLVKRKEELGDV